MAIELVIAYACRNRDEMIAILVLGIGQTADVRFTEADFLIIGTVIYSLRYSFPA